MHPRVAKLYLEFMLLAPELAQSSRGGDSRRAVSSVDAASAAARAGFAGALTSTLSYRASVQREFASVPHVKPGTPEFARCLARGRFALRQLHDMIRVKKFRAMHKRYGWMSQKDSDELVELFGEAAARELVVGLGNKEVYGYRNMLNDDDDDGTAEDDCYDARPQERDGKNR